MELRGGGNITLKHERRVPGGLKLICVISTDLSKLILINHHMLCYHFLTTKFVVSEITIYLTAFLVWLPAFLADRILTVTLMLQCCVRLSPSVTLRIAAKRCFLEQQEAKLSLG